jgi:predicted dienelactone hydrolase
MCGVHALGWRPEEHIVPGADHFVFLAPYSNALASAVPEIRQHTSGFDRVAFHQDFNRLVVGFFSTELRNRGIGSFYQELA